MYKRVFTTWLITNNDRNLFLTDQPDGIVNNLLWAMRFDTEQQAQEYLEIAKDWLKESNLTKIIQIETTIKEKRKANVSKR